MWSQQADFDSDSRLAVNMQRWIHSDVKVQCFAIFIPPEVPIESKFSVGLEMIDLFYEKIIAPYPKVQLIQNANDIRRLNDGEKGAMLTLEGLDLIGNDLFKLRTLIRLGVRMIGLSWNDANFVTDGILEKRGAGLTSFGEQVIALANQERIWIDLSHISYQGFFDAVAHAEYPVASHSNVKAIMNHPRNLDDKQIKAIVDKKGLIGINFVRYFLTTKATATTEDIIYHIQYLIQIGAENCVVFGSDFDGSDDLVDMPRTIDQYNKLITRLRYYFSDSMVNKIAFGNFFTNFSRLSD